MQRQPLLLPPRCVPQWCVCLHWYVSLTRPAFLWQELAAATRIQSVFRGFSLRSELHYQYAATRVSAHTPCPRSSGADCRRSSACVSHQIQAVMRGVLARMRFDKILEEMERELGEGE